MSDEILIQARAMTDMRDQRINALQADLRESNQLAADNFERAKRAEAAVARLRAALEMIAGKRQCLDGLMSNVEIASAALKQKADTE